MIEWLRDRDDQTLQRLHSLVAAVVAQQGAVGWLDVPSLDEAGQWAERELAAVRQGSAHFAVERIGDEFVGMGILSLFRPPVLAHNGEVRKVMTHPDARGRGVARAILTALAGRGRELGLENLVLDVRGNNHGAMAVYESLGWQRYGVLPDFIAVGDERFDQVKYLLTLDRAPQLVRRGQRSEGPGASSRRAD